MSMASTLAAPFTPRPAERMALAAFFMSRTRVIVVRWVEEPKED